MTVNGQLRLKGPFPKTMGEISNIYGVKYPTVYYYAHRLLHLDQKRDDHKLTKDDVKLLLKIFRKRKGNKGRSRLKTEDLVESLTS